MIFWFYGTFLTIFHGRLISVDNWPHAAARLRTPCSCNRAQSYNGIDALKAMKAAAAVTNQQTNQPPIAALSADRDKRADSAKTDVYRFDRLNRERRIAKSE